MLPIQTPGWYATYTKPGKEAFAECQMQRKGIPVFFPQLRIPVTSTRRAKRRIVPLFPNYLFVRIQALHEYACVRWTPGVSYIVSFNGTPAPIDDAIIQFLQQHTSSEGCITAQPTVTPGQETQINDGPFAGLSGLIQHPPNARGRVKVLLSLLGREVSVNIPVHAIESQWRIAWKPVLLYMVVMHAKEINRPRADWSPAILEADKAEQQKHHYPTVCTCPPRPEALTGGLLKFQEKMMQERWLVKRHPTQGEMRV